RQPPMGGGNGGIQQQPAHRGARGRGLDRLRGGNTETPPQLDRPHRAAAPRLRRPKTDAGIKPKEGNAPKKRIAGMLVAVLIMAPAARALAAPLFPGVPENRWARDAVATLAAKGLGEGYPDGTFKGDRAATRWEVAMIVARLLAKMEQEHATFATKAELEEVRKLVSALREELDALGVRVTNLEESTARLDQRVTDLERITFYGLIEARAI